MLALSSATLSFAGSAPLLGAARAQPSMMAKSKALPFLETPAACDGSMAGDVVSRTPVPVACLSCSASLPQPSVTGGLWTASTACVSFRQPPC